MHTSLKKIYKLSKTNIFFSRFEGTRGGKNQIFRALVNQLPNLRFIGRLDSWEVSWSQVEQLRFEINQYNLDVILWESFSTLERQNAFEDHDFVDVEFNPDNADELIGERN